MLGVSRWWDGALHTALSPLSLAAIIALAAALCRQSNDKAVGAFFAAAAGAFVGGMITPIAFGNIVGPAGAVFAGLAAALALSLRFGIAAPLAALIGLSAGVAASPDERLTIEMAGGVAFAVLVIGANVELALAWFSRLEAAIPRVLGAWCAAIGIMMGMLAFAH